ncbi:hypothetical protein GO755_00005 [Spirosoma sp. HMF4905]|uniref:Uncharacterized protein n=1 Tax=Spirosoma arboris TaxID=2682092 RepID=A0A7K1S3I7_9BACT|nr:hypothetical protein [Spirosoma arboris]MVM28394.1 hypothetical protein [Spirosoma arboris]
MNTEITVPIRVVGIKELERNGLLEFLREYNFEGIEIYQHIGPFAQTGPVDKLWVIVGRVEVIFSLMSSLMAITSQLQSSNESAPKTQINVTNIINEGGNRIYTIEGKAGPVDTQDLIKQTKDSIELLNAQINLEKAKAQLEEVRNGKQYRKLK